MIHSAESGLNEYCLPLFQETELRIYPPGYNTDIVPLYQYLFHECIILHGMMGNAPEPYHLVIRNAANCVLGGIPGGVLTGDGTLLDKDTNNWAEWDPKVENSNNAFRMIQAVTALRRSPAKDFLIFGRMLRPAEVQDIKDIKWSSKGQLNKIPAVFHIAWQSPDGRFGVVLANWTDKNQNIILKDNRLKNEKKSLSFWVSAEKLERNVKKIPGNRINIELPPVSCGVVHT